MGGTEAHRVGVHEAYSLWEVLKHTGWGFMGGAEAHRVGVHGRC